MAHIPTSLNERHLVSRIRAGEHVAFKELYNRYHAGLISFAHNYVISDADVDDIVAELFLALWRTRADWNPQGTVASYLYKSVRNRALNYIRDRSTENRYQSDAVNAEPNWGMSESPVQQDLSLEIVESEGIVWATVATLPERSRTILTLRWKENLNPEEIAGVLGISTGAVHTAYTRALTALRARLPKDFRSM